MVLIFLGTLNLCFCRNGQIYVFKVQEAISHVKVGLLPGEFARSGKVARSRHDALSCLDPLCRLVRFALFLPIYNVQNRKITYLCLSNCMLYKITFISSNKVASLLNFGSILISSTIIGGN